MIRQELPIFGINEKKINLLSDITVTVQLQFTKNELKENYKRSAKTTNETSI